MPPPPRRNILALGLLAQALTSLAMVAIIFDPAYTPISLWQYATKLNATLWAATGALLLIAALTGTSLARRLALPASATLHASHALGGGVLAYVTWLSGAPLPASSMRAAMLILLHAGLGINAVMWAKVLLRDEMAAAIAALPPPPVNGTPDAAS